MINESKLKGILLSKFYVSEDDMKEAEKFAKAHNSSFVDYLLTQSLVTRELLGQALAEAYGIPFADLHAKPPPKEQVLKTPEAAAKKYRIVIYQQKGKDLVVATDNPEQSNLDNALKNVYTDKNVSLAYALPSDLDAVYMHYQKPFQIRFVEIIKNSGRVIPEIIGEILKDAFAYRASDIHFDPQENDVLVRFRIDGLLQEVGRIPKEYYENVLNRIKVQAHLRIDEHYSAQDGAIRYLADGTMVDLRISIVPTLDGEKITARILSAYVQNLTLADLGLSPKDQEAVISAGKKPFGMVLVTGPTGSGKTTTLYALLKLLNSPAYNIMTIEDPVEYKMTGANQIQVDPKTNLTFAAGLKSILRQNPDIVLVGEIRDSETAEIAVNLSLTGHLMLSTFHANDAATAIPRLFNMGVEPFLLASTLELVIAQRLVRRICSNCRVSQVVTAKDLAAQLPDPKSVFGKGSVTLYKGKGCKSCGNTGYMGRTAIYELIPMDREMRELVLRQPTAQQIWELARKKGSRKLFEDGIDKVKNGITTLDELLRVAQPPANT